MLYIQLITTMSSQTEQAANHHASVVLAWNHTPNEKTTLYKCKKISSTQIIIIAHTHTHAHVHTYTRTHLFTHTRIYEMCMVFDYLINTTMSIQLSNPFSVRLGSGEVSLMPLN